MPQISFQEILKNYWGYDTFRPLQEDIIKSIWASQDTLGVMPTGGGKSITFQVPVMAMPGICLVVTPLIALMKDQVDGLRARGIKAATVYSGMSRDEIITTLENCIFGGFKFLYISPERLSSDIFLAKVRMMNICLLVIDESHCISQWGYDFRPSYLKIANIRHQLPDVPLLALTATATNEVVKDIQEKLEFKNPNLFKVSFERKNLAYIVRRAENKIGELIHILNKVPGTAIVYVRSRQETKDIATALRKEGFEADYFHAGLSREAKTVKQNAWKCNECRIIVSTNAFGMGIDKPDVRLVVHLDLPNSLEEYYQEAGRAGRDGKKSYAVILYNRSDSAKLKKRISDTFPKRNFLLTVYDALCNFLQVALGSGTGNVYDFNLIQFCSAFKLPILQTHHALKILDLAQYIDYTEEIDSRSRLQFIVNRDELYDLRLQRDYDDLLHSVLRNYTGIFSEYTYIDEGTLAVNLGKKRQEIYDMLVALAKMRIIKYIPQKRTPFIIYNCRREEAKNLHIPQSVYEERRRRFEKRISAMTHYVEDDKICRSRRLLTYFDETDNRDCGICDVCLKKAETPLSNNELQQISKKVFDCFIDNHSLRISDLVARIDFVGDEKIIKTIRYLVDSGELILKDDTLSLYKNEKTEKQ